MFGPSCFIYGYLKRGFMGREAEKQTKNDSKVATHPAVTNPILPFNLKLTRSAQFRTDFISLVKGHWMH